MFEDETGSASNEVARQRHRPDNFVIVRKKRFQVQLLHLGDWTEPCGEVRRQPGARQTQPRQISGCKWRARQRRMIRPNHREVAVLEQFHADQVVVDWDELLVTEHGVEPTGPQRA